MLDEEVDVGFQKCIERLTWSCSAQRHAAHEVEDGVATRVENGLQHLHLAREDAVDGAHRQADAFADLLQRRGLETAFGKSVFAGWTKTDLGKTSEISLDYVHQLIAPPEEGGTYEFVLEKQSGSAGAYLIEINAPVGYRWKENHLPVFTFASDSIPGRTLIELTYEKAED